MSVIHGNTSEGESMRGALRQKTAVITGAARGMGRAIARAFATEGANLALLDSQNEPLQEVSDDLRALGATVYSRVLDVRDNQTLQTTFDSIESDLGPIDIAVNSAGVGIYRVIEELTEEDWDTTFDINVKGTFLVCKAAASRMAGRGRGLIINIASLAVKIRGFERGVCYTSSKYAVEGLSRCLAVELRPKGVRVCCLCPGTTDTHFRGEPTGNENLMLAEDVASAALYVATQRESVAVHDVVISMINEAW